MTRSRSAWVLAGIVAVAGLNLVAVTRRAPAEVKAASAGADNTPPSVVAGPGLTEPKSEAIRLSAQVAGVLARVLVDEGDHVTAGQVVATLVNDDYLARLASAEATLRSREADARRVENGARDEERRVADAEARQAEADLTRMKADHARAVQLFADALISRAEMDRAEQSLRGLSARFDAVRERQALVEADAREEDRTHARAEVALAQAQVIEARALLAKTIVRSPIDGVVLRRHAKSGERVSPEFDSPIVTLADRSSIRVRMDVDETDVARIKVGQLAYITADAFGTRRFPGRVWRVGQILGKKNVRTDEPTERIDQKVLETLIELEDGRELPIGLRVRAFIVD